MTVRAPSLALLHAVADAILPNACLRPSQEATRLEEQTTARLIKSKKLSLIVDLDQTVIQATVDPTVGEWLDDPHNPNFAALAGTRKFRLGDEQDDTGWYYVKPR